jgi:hypothetical protein
MAQENKHQNEQQQGAEKAITFVAVLPEVGHLGELGK